MVTNLEEKKSGGCTDGPKFDNFLAQKCATHLFAPSLLEEAAVSNNDKNDSVSQTFIKFLRKLYDAQFIKKLKNWLFKKTGNSILHALAFPTLHYIRIRIRITL